MSDAPVRLNKPLYKEDVTEDPGTPMVPLPRPARANVWARAAAIVVEFLLLHVVCMILVRVFPDTVAGFGKAGPFLGLLLAMAYLTFANLTGFSVGRLVLSHTLVSRSGEPIGPVLAVVRAGMIIFPLVIHQICQLTMDRLTVPDSISVIPPLIGYGGLALVAAWYGSNFMCVAFDSVGRSFYDRILGTQVLAATSELEDQAQLLQSAREKADRMDLSRIGMISAGVAVTLPIMLVLAFISMVNTQLKSNPEILERNLAERKLLHVPGFSQPISRQPVPSSEAEKQTTDTMGIQFDYTRLGIVTADEVAANAVANSVIDRATSITAGMWKLMVDQQIATTGSQRLDEIRKVRNLVTKVDFVQRGDLFFASNPRSVYSTSRSLPLVRGELTTETLKQVWEKAQR